jgi:hypothetical protein
MRAKVLQRKHIKPPGSRGPNRKRVNALKAAHGVFYTLTPDRIDQIAAVHPKALKEPPTYKSWRERWFQLTGVMPGKNYRKP